jgi:hypothetical protein
MARKHIPLTIVRPGVEELVPYVFEAVDATDKVAFIPFRYAFADIANVSALQSAGFFRHGLQQPSGGAASAAVSSELGGSASADTLTNLGYHLPRTEKLILLVKVVTPFTADADIATITLSGSEKYNQPEVELTIDTGVNTTADAAGTIYEIDLYNFGLYIGDNAELKITVATETVADYDHLQFALVARSF